MISVPNQLVHDLSKNPNEFHFRHYSPKLLKEIFEDEFGLKMTKQWVQNVYHFDEEGVKLGPLEASDMKPFCSENMGENLIILYQKICS